MAGKRMNITITIKDALGEPDISTKMVNTEEYRGDHDVLNAFVLKASDALRAVQRSHDRGEGGDNV